MDDKLAWALAAVADQAREVAKLIQQLGQRWADVPGVTPMRVGPGPELGDIESQLTNVNARIEAYLKKHPPGPGRK